MSNRQSTSNQRQRRLSSSSSSSSASGSSSFGSLSSGSSSSGSAALGIPVFAPLTTADQAEMYQPPKPVFREFVLPLNAPVSELGANLASRMMMRYEQTDKPRLFARGNPAIKIKPDKAIDESYRRNSMAANVAIIVGHEYDKETDNPSAAEVKDRLTDPRYILHGHQVEMRTGIPMKTNTKFAQPLGKDVLAKAKKQHKAKTNPGPVDRAKNLLKGKGRRRPPDGGSGGASTSGS